MPNEEVWEWNYSGYDLPGTAIVHGNTVQITYDGNAGNSYSISLDMFHDWIANSLYNRLIGEREYFTYRKRE